MNIRQIVARRWNANRRNELPPPSPRWLRLTWNLITILIVLWAAPRLLPHLGAVAGVDSGGHVTPVWSARTLDGQLIGSDALRGRVVLVNVWATWCLPCRAEMPLLEAMHQRHRASGFTLVGLSVDRGPESEVRAFLATHGVTYSVAIVSDPLLGAFGGVRGYPTSFLIDRDGIVRHAVIGPLAPASLELAVRRLLRTPTTARGSGPYDVGLVTTLGPESSSGRWGRHWTPESSSGQAESSAGRG